jgi:hypothetical protein
VVFLVVTVDRKGETVESTEVVIDPKIVPHKRTPCGKAQPEESKNPEKVE